jgi:hypothetical protein
MLLLFMATGCSVVEAGAPVPVDGTSRPGTTSGSAQGEADPLDGVEPCDVLSAEDRAAIGLEEGEHRGMSCDWKKTFEVGVILTLFPRNGAGDLTEQGSPVDVGTFDAYLIEKLDGVDGSCSLVLDTSPTSYVAMTAISEKNTEAACELVVAVAERVDDRLS